MTLDAGCAGRNPASTLFTPRFSPLPAFFFHAPRSGYHPIEASPLHFCCIFYSFSLWLISASAKLERAAMGKVYYSKHIIFGVGMMRPENNLLLDIVDYKFC